MTSPHLTTVRPITATSKPDEQVQVLVPISAPEEPAVVVYPPGAVIDQRLKPRDTWTDMFVVTVSENKPCKANEQLIPALYSLEYM
ncbi:hypothetical protein F2P81_016156 [Scophthalmus maximus]|uniref:Uncharacterized protein n=1 Tax=Scophthalmus maximus TaxID=52904 RepID=A0A6A4SKE3_SCOMX|nr:hypothetical protein F2P81_016156 [Scophthalmus maximus]